MIETQMLYGGAAMARTGRTQTPDAQQNVISTGRIVHNKPGSEKWSTATWRWRNRSDLATGGGNGAGFSFGLPFLFT